jgi:hypothetical protein
MPPVQILFWFVGPFFQCGAKEIVALKDGLGNIPNSSNGAACLGVDMGVKVQ